MPTTHSLAGRIALVTRGTSGLGRAAAEAAAAAGAHVVIADIDEAGGRDVAGALAGSFVALDVAEEAAWLELEAPGGLTGPPRSRQATKDHVFQEANNTHVCSVRPWMFSPR